MNIKIEEIKRYPGRPFSERHFYLLGCVCDLSYRKNSGRHIAARALLSSDRSVGIAVALFVKGSDWTEETVAGACSWRPECSGVGTEEVIKRINTGVLYRGRGVGRALVEFLRERYPTFPHYCKSLPQAWGFCRAMGMVAIEDLPDGRKLFVDK